MEEVAQRQVQYLYENVTNRESGGRACSLVRFIKRIFTNRTNRNCRSSLKMFWGVCLNPKGFGRGEFAMGAGDYKNV